jgi:hypothetical protein
MFEISVLKVLRFNCTFIVMRHCTTCNREIIFFYHVYEMGNISYITNVINNLINPVGNTNERIGLA